MELVQSGKAMVLCRSCEPAGDDDEDEDEDDFIKGDEEEESEGDMDSTAHFGEISSHESDYASECSDA